MKRLAFLLLAALPLCGCGDPADPDNRAGNAAAAAAHESRSADAGDRNTDAPEQGDPPIRRGGAGDRASRPADPEEADPDGADRCGASRYQSLVGRPRSAIPAEPPGETWRIACTSCPITMDYSPDRLNIFYDEETQIVEEVRCG